MNRQQLAHVLRAACAVAKDPNVLVLGSQSILGSFEETELPAEATSSIEADIAFLNDPDRQKADRVDGAIGELSAFHDTNGVYAEGVHIATAILPVGWRERLVGWDLKSSQPASPRFLDPHDLAVAKLAAHREKDTDFVSALIRVGLLGQMTELAAQLEPGQQSCPWRHRCGRIHTGLRCAPLLAGVMNSLT